MSEVEKIEKIKERFANLSWEHFYQEFLDHYYSEEVGEE